MDLMRSSHRKTPPPRIGASLAGVGPTIFTLQRAWPTQAGDALAQYQSSSGELVAAKWFRDPRVCAQENEKTPGAIMAVPWQTDDPSGIEEALTGHVLLYPRGADRKLRGLADAAEAGHLIAHRPQRRAVLAMPASSEYPAHFLKIVRDGKSDELIAAHEALAEITLPGVELARLLEHRPELGWTRWSTVPGETLYSLLTTRHADTVDEVALWRSVGRFVAAIHDSEGSGTGREDGTDALPASKVHGPIQETEVIRTWLDRAATHGVLHVDSRLVQVVLDELTLPSPGPRGIIHRDLHDKQILVNTGGTARSGSAALRLGIVDVDTLAIGERALDLGNLLAHFSLRQVQGLVSVERVEKWTAALLEGYGPADTVLARIDAYRTGTILRLAAVYAFRPKWRDSVREWAMESLYQTLASVPAPAR